MDIQYLSSSDQAQFAEILHDGGELPDLFAALMLQMSVDTDYSAVMVSCESDEVLRVVVEDSPYIIVLDGEQQQITLYTRSDFGDLEEFDGDYDFDDDGVEIVIDIMASRILSGENDDFE